MRTLIALGLAFALPVRAELLDDRVVLASVLAHSVIIEAQSREALFFERCRYEAPHDHPATTEISADHLFDCVPLGPILPNTPVVREYLEQRFVNELEKRLERLDRTGYAMPIARSVGAAAAIGGIAIGGLERATRRPGLRQVLATGALGSVAAGTIALVIKLYEARQARYEQTRSKQILKVIDLRIPPEPHFVDERATSRSEAAHVMKLFTESLKVAAEQTRSAAPVLTYRSDAPTAM